MADAPEDPTGDPSADSDRQAILRRRNRWIALALSSVAAGSLAGCTPCLSLAADTGPSIDAGPDAGAPQPCLSPLPDDAGPDAGPPTAPDGGPPADAG